MSSLHNDALAMPTSADDSSWTATTGELGIQLAKSIETLNLQTRAILSLKCSLALSRMCEVVSKFHRRLVVGAFVKIRVVPLRSSNEMLLHQIAVIQKTTAQTEVKMESDPDIQPESGSEARSSDLNGVVAETDACAQGSGSDETQSTGEDDCQAEAESDLAKADSDAASLQDDDVESSKADDKATRASVDLDACGCNQLEHNTNTEDSLSNLNATNKQDAAHNTDAPSSEPNGSSFDSAGAVDDLDPISHSTSWTHNGPEHISDSSAEFYEQLTLLRQELEALAQIELPAPRTVPDVVPQKELPAAEDLEEGADIVQQVDESVPQQEQGHKDEEQQGEKQQEEEQQEEEQQDEQQQGEGSPDCDGRPSRDDDNSNDVLAVEQTIETNCDTIVTTPDDASDSTSIHDPADEIPMDEFESKAEDLPENALPTRELDLIGEENKKLTVSLKEISDDRDELEKQVIKRQRAADALCKRLLKLEREYEEVTLERDELRRKHHDMCEQTYRIQSTQNN